MKRSLLGIFLLVAASCFGQVGSNPFTAKDSRPHSEGFIRTMTSGTAAIFVNAMAPIQKSLNESLAAITRSLEGSRSLAGLLFVMLVSLVYGMFHAAGPGHGKTIVSSFLLANDAKVRHGIIVGYLIAAVHAIAALAVVLILYYLIRGLFSVGVKQADHYIQLVTFGVVAVLCALMLVAESREGTSPSPPHGEGKWRPYAEKPVGMRYPPAPCLCPRAIRCDPLRPLPPHAGRKRLSVIFISLGMGLTISLTGSHRDPRQARGDSRSGGRSGKDSLLHRIIEIGGAGILFLFGLVFFLAQL